MYRTIIYTAALLIVAVSAAADCSCDPPDIGTCDHGDVAMHGKVVSEPEYCGDVVFYDVKVWYVVKNMVEGLEIAEGDTVTVINDFSEECGLELMNGKDYLIYANAAGEGMKIVAKEDDKKEDSAGGDAGKVKASVTGEGKAQATATTNEDGEKNQETASAKSRKLLEDIPSVKDKDVVKDVPKKTDDKNKLDDVVKELPKAPATTSAAPEKPEKKTTKKAVKESECSKEAVLEYGQCSVIESPSREDVAAAKKACSA